jgi:hypothetical protein
MVSSDGDFVWVGKASEPVNGGLDIACRTVVAEVARVDEKVSVRYVWPFEGVGIRDADYSDWLSARWRESRRSAQTE